MNKTLATFLGWMLNALLGFVGYKYPVLLPVATGLIGGIVGWLHLPTPESDKPPTPPTLPMLFMLAFTLIVPILIFVSCTATDREKAQRALDTAGKTLDQACAERAATRDGGAPVVAVTPDAATD